MMRPPIGKRKTRRHHRTLLRGGRLDLSTSTAALLLVTNIRRGSLRHTENDDIQDQDNESQNTSPGSIFPGILLGSDGLLNGSTHGEGQEGEESKLEIHFGWLGHRFG